MSHRIGLIGHGRIGSSLRERIEAAESMQVAFVRTRPGTDVPDEVPVLSSLEDADEVDADLVVEAATQDVVEAVGPTILSSTSLLVLSTTALADPELFSDLRHVAATSGTQLLVPHGAILGTDGIRDARDVVTEVHITTQKNPANLDFSFTDLYDPADITERTVLYQGPTRDLCRQFPRNVNSHATVALAGIGFDETRSTLIADPDLETADHRITVECEGASLSIERSSQIQGVTGGYTIESIWGTIRNYCGDGDGFAVV